MQENYPHDRRAAAQREEDRVQDERLDHLEERLDKIEELLRPISQAFTTSSQLGKWIMGAMVFISITLGLILSWKSLLHK